MLCYIFKWLKLGCTALLLSILFPILKLLYFIPCSKEIIAEKFAALSTLSKEEFDGSLFTWIMFKEVLKQIKLDIFKSAKQGKRAPEMRLCKVDISETDDQAYPDAGNKIATMSQMQKPGTPLVITFGSCSCPPFMANLERFVSISEKYSSVADFAFIYVTEAHPQAGWHFRV